MLKTGSGTFTTEDYVQELYRSKNDKSKQKFLEAQIKSRVRNVNPLAAAGDIYLNYSPTGSYSFLSDHVAISTEAYAAVVMARCAEIGEIIERGESLELHGVTYEQYFTYVALQGSAPDKSTYKFLCYEGKSRAYFDEQAIALYDRWAEGEDIPREELNKWSQYGGESFRKAEYRRELNQNANRLTEALANNGIVLDKDEKLDIKLSANGKYTVSGIEDVEKRQKIEEVVNETLSTVFISEYLNLPDSPVDTWVAPNAEAFQFSMCVGAAEEYLAQTGDGVTLKDLYLDKQGNICGGLPQETLDKLNRIAIVKDIEDEKNFTKEEGYLCKNKLAITLALSTIAAHGTDNLPKLGYHFAYQEGKLTVVDSRFA